MRRGSGTDLLGYMAARILASALGALPAKVSRRVTLSILAPGCYFLFAERRRIGMINLSLARQPGAEQILPAVFQNLALTAHDSLEFSRSKGRKQILVVSEESRSIYDQLRKRRESMIFVTAHLGNWELLGAAASAIGLPAYSFAKPLKNPFMDRWIRSMREVSGQRMLSGKGAFRLALAALREGLYLALAVDQRPRRKQAVPVTFLGVQTQTTKLPGLLSIRTGAPITAACAVRQAVNEPLQVYFSEPIYPRKEGTREEELQRISNTYCEVLEGWIRRFPEQWLWLHRRFSKSFYGP